MAYREVTMLEVKEVLRLWLGGARNKRIAAQLGLNVKTVRRYVAAGQASGVTRERGPEALEPKSVALRSSPTTKKREPREHSERARRTGADEDRKLRRVEQRTGRERELRDEDLLKTGFVQRVRRVARREGSRRRAGPRAGRDGAALSQRARR